MMRFFTQMHPKIPCKSSNTRTHPECLTVVNGNLVPCGTPIRNYVKKGDKQHPNQAGGSRQEREAMKMPGFVHPQTLNEEGYFTQKARDQIEEMKKKKTKPSLHKPEGRE